MMLDDASANEFALEGMDPSIKYRQTLIIQMEAYLLNRLPSRRDMACAYGWDRLGNQDLLFFYELNKRQVLIINYNDHLETLHHRGFGCYIGTYPNLYRWHRRYPERIQTVCLDCSLEDLGFIGGLLDSLDLSQ